MFYELELIKERVFTMFDTCFTAADARDIFEEIGRWIMAAGIPPLKSWYRRTERIWHKISGYFAERVTSAVSEGINNVIKSLKRRAFGYKDMEYFKLKIMQVAGYLTSRYFPKNIFDPFAGDHIKVNFGG